MPAKLCRHGGKELKKPLSAAETRRKQGLVCSALVAAAPSLLKKLVEFVGNHKPERDVAHCAVSCNAAQRNWVLPFLGLINCLPGGRCW